MNRIAAPTLRWLGIVAATFELVATWLWYPAAVFALTWWLVNR